MTTKYEKIHQSIEIHGKNLIMMFKLPKSTDPIKLYKQLKRLEDRTTKLSVDTCNTGKSHDKELSQVLRKLRNILFPGRIKDKWLYSNVFINTDPNGYALKIQSEYCLRKTIYRDMGGYGIIAPDFTDD